MELVFGIVSTKRKKNYLEKVLVGLVKTGFFAVRGNWPLYIFSDAEKGDVGVRVDPERVVLVDLPAEERRKYELGDDPFVAGKRRIAWNHSRALRLLPGRAGDVAVVFEDDVEFAEGWLPRLRRTLEDLVRTVSSPWVLSLFVPDSRAPLEAYRNGKLWIPYPVLHPSYPFWGQQGLAYPREVALRRADYLEAHCVERWERIPADHSMVGFLAGIGGSLLATAPCLIQHVGTETAGGGGGHVRTPSFLKKVE